MSAPHPTAIDIDIDIEAEAEKWCEHCHNTGSLDCHCGGDLCICERNGEYPCPYCSEEP